MIALITRLLKIRIVRYALVGGVGILINEGALFCFLHLFEPALPPKSVFLYPISWFLAFEVSNITNFTLNQFFTYREQVKDIHGWEWMRRAFKGQLASISAMLISLVVSWALYFTLHIDPYIASFIGMVAQFFYNFFISNKLVYRAIEQKTAEPAQDTPFALDEVEQPI